MKIFKEFLLALEACQEMAMDTGKLHTVRQRYSDRKYMVIQGMGPRVRSRHVYTARPTIIPPMLERYMDSAPVSWLED